MNDLAKSKRVANDLGLKWEAAASSLVAYASAHGCQMAAARLGRMASQADISLLALHTCSVVWLLHHRGLLREAKSRARKDAVSVRIIPNQGMRGIYINFETIPPDVVAANDNIVSSQRFH